MRIVVVALFSLVLTLPAMAGEPSTITTSGVGEINLVPDLARLSMTVEASSTDSSEAANEVAKTVSSILAMLSEKGVANTDVQSTAARVSPKTRWDPETREQRFEGYNVSRELAVTLRDLAALSTVIERSVALGVDRLSPPQLDSSEREAISRQALTLAYEDALARANVLAEAAAIKVTGALSIDAQGNSPPPRPPMRLAAADSMTESFEVGELTIASRITVVFSAAP
ncbi:SIMPL domain-containing protein [Luminiphilus syltensis]|nr:SIMPL domain-containing protein [Luminiphilus syltensis]